ncbi:MAG: precorrin-8X methylmutase [Thermodesulfobacteriota bacterium]
MKPEDIEALSFEIIDAEAGAHPFVSKEWQIVRRMIHTTADFEWIQTVRFHPKAVSAGIDAIRSGKPIVTDTHMAASGINRTRLAEYGTTIHCLVDDPQVAEQARQAGTTRSLAAVDQAVSQFPEAVFVIGNAPTALLRLIELIRNGSADPALVIGLPVGFVQAAESKAELMKLDRPLITNVGRKGGSAVAASVVNALALLARPAGGAADSCVGCSAAKMK